MCRGNRLDVTEDAMQPCLQSLPDDREQHGRQAAAAAL